MNVTKKRDEIIEKIEQSVIPNNERILLEKAKFYSDTLMNLETYSMQLTLDAYGIKAEDYEERKGLSFSNSLSKTIY